MAMVWINIGWDCPICHEDLQVHTDADQAGTKHNVFNWYAHDGDLIRCLGCGAKGQIVPDDDHAEIDFSANTPHNVACAEAYRAREK